eukprot:343217-Pyramimonas_sp.AAC.1
MDWRARTNSTAAASRSWTFVAKSRSSAAVCRVRRRFSSRGALRLFQCRCRAGINPLWCAR